MYIPYVLHRSLPMLCVITHCSGPLLHQAAARWCKRMRNDCLINIFLFCLMISLLTAHSFSGMGPKPFPHPLCSLLFFCCLICVMCGTSCCGLQLIRNRGPLSLSDKSSGALFGFPNYPYVSRNESWHVPAFVTAGCSCYDMDRECPELPHFFFYRVPQHFTLWTRPMLSMPAIPSVSYCTPSA